MKIDIERYNKSTMPENAEKYFYGPTGHKIYIYIYSFFFFLGGGGGAFCPLNFGTTYRFVFCFLPCAKFNDPNIIKFFFFGGGGGVHFVP